MPTCVTNQPQSPELLGRVGECPRLCSGGFINPVVTQLREPSLHLAHCGCGYSYRVTACVSPCSPTSSVSEPDVPQINQQQSNSYLEACLLARAYGPFLLGHKSNPSPRAQLLCPPRFWLAPTCCGLLQGKQTNRLNITSRLQRDERFVFKSVYTTKHITRI